MKLKISIYLKTIVFSYFLVEYLFICVFILELLYLNIHYQLGILYINKYNFKFVFKTHYKTNTKVCLVYTNIYTLS